MNDLIIVGIVEPIVAGVVGVILWITIQRRIERRDQELETLHAELKALRDEKFQALQEDIATKLEAIDRRLAGEATARRDLDQKVQDDFARTRDLTAIAQTITELFSKVNRMDRDVAHGNAITELIARHLKINFSGTQEA